MFDSSIGKLIQRKNAILFDLFHTLTAVESSWAKIPMTSEILGVSKEKWFEQLFEKSPARLTGLEKDPFKIIGTMARAINPNISEDLIREATEKRMLRFERAVANIPQSTRQTLKTLKEQKKKIGLISNADIAEIKGWDKSPIAQYFDSVIFSCYVGYAKPDKRIYEISLEELNERPENSVFIGDGGSSELKGAKSMGITTVMITGVIKEILPEAISERKKHADFVIEHISELIE
jgi:putative hydrolase of the HAD superfamily